MYVIIIIIMAEFDGRMLESETWNVVQDMHSQSGHEHTDQVT